MYYWILKTSLSHSIILLPRVKSNKKRLVHNKWPRYINKTAGYSLFWYNNRRGIFLIPSLKKKKRRKRNDFRLKKKKELLFILPFYTTITDTTQNLIIMTLCSSRIDRWISSYETHNEKIVQLMENWRKFPRISLLRMKNRKEIIRIRISHRFYAFLKRPTREYVSNLRRKNRCNSSIQQFSIRSKLGKRKNNETVQQFPNLSNSWYTKPNIKL